MNFLKTAALGIGGGFLPNSLFKGNPEVRQNVSTLRPEQERGYQNLQAASQGRGAGGVFGDVADYYRNNLSDNPADLDAMVAPEMRRFNQQTIPGLAEQFAGMGSGALDSSGFRNASINAGTDLAERIASIRAGIRERGAQGLANIGQMGLQPYSQNMVTQQGTQGLLPGLANVAGTAAANYFGGPAGGALYNAATNLSGNKNGQNFSYGMNPPQMGAR
jgi:hypothetical protein